MAWDLWRIIWEIDLYTVRDYERLCEKSNSLWVTQLKSQPLQNIFIQQIDHLRRRPRSIYALMLLVLQTSFWAAIGRSGTRILVYSMWIVLSVTLHLKVNWIWLNSLVLSSSDKKQPFWYMPELVCIYMIWCILMLCLLVSKWY